MDRCSSTTTTTTTTTTTLQEFNKSCSQASNFTQSSPFPPNNSSHTSVINNPNSVPSTSFQYASDHFSLMRHPLDISMGNQFPLIRGDKNDFDYSRHNPQHFPQFFDCLSCHNPQSVNEGYYSTCPPTLLPPEVEYDLRNRGGDQYPHNASVEDFPYYIDFNVVPIQGHDLASLANNNVESKHELLGKDTIEYLSYQSGIDSSSSATNDSLSAPPTSNQIKSENTSDFKHRQEGKTNNRGVSTRKKTNLQDNMRKHRRREQNRIAARKCREKKKVQVDTILKGYQRTIKENERLMKEVEELHGLNNKLSDVINGHQKLCPLLQNTDVISVLRGQATSSSPVAIPRGSPSFHGVPGFNEQFCEYSPDSQSNPTSQRNVFYQP